MTVNPLTFSEFLLANGGSRLLNVMENWQNLDPIPPAFFNPLLEQLKMYFVTGGLPEPVFKWTEARDVNAMQEALSGIISSRCSGLRKYRELFPGQTKLLVRFSLDNLELNGRTLNIPLFLADHADRLMGWRWIMWMVHSRRGSNGS